MKVTTLIIIILSSVLNVIIKQNFIKLKSKLETLGTKGVKSMKKLSLTDRLIIHCVLFLVEGLGRTSEIFYNFNVDHFVAEIKKLLSEKEDDFDAGESI